MTAIPTELDEKKLQELPYFDKVQTYTKPSFTAMTLTFKVNTPAKDVPQLFYQLRKKLGDIRGQLPNGIQGPFFNDEFGDVYGNIYALHGTGFASAGRSSRRTPST